MINMELTPNLSCLRFCLVPPLGVCLRAFLLLSCSPALPWLLTSLNVSLDHLRKGHASECWIGWVHVLDHSALGERAQLRLRLQLQLQCHVITNDIDDGCMMGWMWVIMDDEFLYSRPAKLLHIIANHPWLAGKKKRKENTSTN